MAVSGGVRQAALSLRSPQTLATSVDSSWRRGGPGAWDGRACSREVHLGSLFLFDPAIQQAKIGVGRGEEEDLKVSQGSIRLWCQGPTPRSLAASSANCRGAGQLPRRSLTVIMIRKPVDGEAACARGRVCAGRRSFIVTDVQGKE